MNKKEEQLLSDREKQIRDLETQNYNARQEIDKLKQEIIYQRKIINALVR